MVSTPRPRLAQCPPDAGAARVIVAGIGFGGLATSGRIMVGPDPRVSGHDRFFAVGDIALIDCQPLPQLAQPELPMGRHAAAQVRRLMAGQSTEPFSYRDKVIMATIERLSALVNLAYRYLTWGHGGAVIVDSDPSLPGLGSEQA